MNIILVFFSYSIRDLSSFQSATMKNALNSILILTFVLSQQAQHCSIDIFHAIMALAKSEG